MSDRDPRIDPKRGDILVKPGKLREVDNRLDDYVFWSVPGVPIQRGCNLQTWRRWARNAMVEHKA